MLRLGPKPSPGWYLNIDSTHADAHASSVSQLSCTSKRPNAMASYSKAPRGLFVLLRVIRIFTHTSISPGPLLRQCSTRYAFRAGRNLPDKEFRYLRTVIVTAAVHRGFISLALTTPLNLPALGRRQPLYFSLRFCRDLCFW